MEENNMFSPTMDQAKGLANNYWSDLSGYREKALNDLSNAIKASASVGRYEITYEILKSEKDYFKSKLECVGYHVELLHSRDEKHIYVKISFK